MGFLDGLIDLAVQAKKLQDEFASSELADVLRETRDELNHTASAFVSEVTQIKAEAADTVQLVQETASETVHAVKDKAAQVEQDIKDVPQTVRRIVVAQSDDDDSASPDAE